MTHDWLNPWMYTSTETECQLSSYMQIFFYFWLGLVPLTPSSSRVNYNKNKKRTKRISRQSSKMNTLLDIHRPHKQHRKFAFWASVFLSLSSLIWLKINKVIFKTTDHKNCIYTHLVSHKNPPCEYVLILITISVNIFPKKYPLH